MKKNIYKINILAEKSNSKARGTLGFKTGALKYKHMLWVGKKALAWVLQKALEWISDQVCHLGDINKSLSCTRSNPFILKA